MRQPSCCCWGGVGANVARSPPSCILTTYSLLRERVAQGTVALAWVFRRANGGRSVQHVQVAKSRGETLDLGDMTLFMLRYSQGK